MNSNDEIIKRYKPTLSGYTSSRYSRLNRIIDTEGDEYIESYEPISFPERSDDRFY